MATFTVTMRVHIPWFVTWIIAPPIMALHHLNLISSETACNAVAWGVRAEAI